MNASCTPQPTASCTPGCTCSNDTVFNGTQCVNPAACPCFHEGYFRKPSSRWSSGCKECICWHNKIICQPKECTPVTYCPSPLYKIIHSNCCDICIPVPPAVTTKIPTVFTQIPTTTICLSTEFLCETNGSCISKQWLCDGQLDCPGKEDEQNCPGGVSLCSEPLGKYTNVSHVSTSFNNDRCNIKINLEVPRKKGSACIRDLRTKTISTLR